MAQDRPSPNDQRPSPIDRGDWIVVKEWSGGPGQAHKLDAFARPPRPWRLAYTTEAGEPGQNGVVDILVRNKANRLVTAAYNLQGSVTGFLAVGEEHPEYYIQVNSHGPRWRVAVEQAAAQ